MYEVIKIAKKNNLKIIEDTALSIGSKIGSKFSGTFGDAGAFSFHPVKIITTGEGGAIILKNKKDYERIADEFAEQLETQEKNVQMLKSSLSVLERKISEAKRKKDILIARQKRAQVEKKMYEQIATIDGSTSVFETFDRLEEKVNRMEAEADAAKEITMSEAEILKEELLLLDAGDDVDDELERMKMQLGMSKEPELIEGKVEESPKSEIDEELEALKEKL